jgi:outer membrane protein assembly factor BamB
VPPSYATIYRTRPKRRYLVLPLVPLLTAAAAAGAVTTVSAQSAREASRFEGRPGKVVVQRRRPARAPARARAMNESVRGLTTFRGNASRSYYGRGPVPREPVVLWRYPRSGGMCMRSADEHGVETWCGVGWTGQPNVMSRESGGYEIRFGAYDGRYHFLDGQTGEPLRPDLVTGDLAKGSATSDPDGYPLYYAGSRDNLLRVVALDRPRPRVLWSLDSHNVPRLLWNDDWDGAPLVVGDYLLEGGENSWFYVIKLNRGYDAHGKVRVSPKVVVRVPGWDDELLKALPDSKVSIESSVAYHKGVAYFANSGGLVQGWDISRVLRGGEEAKRVFRFWTGDDTDASIVVDREGYLYVASELERLDRRSTAVGQLIKLDPRRPQRPLVWSLPIREGGSARAGGVWATPAIDRGMLYVPTNYGDLIGVNRRTGRALWRIHLAGPTWGSPVVVDGVLLQGDCSGVLHAFDVSRQRVRPPELWQIRLGGCIESTPAVFDGTIWIGTRGGAMYALGDTASRER